MAAGCGIAAVLGILSMTWLWPAVARVVWRLEGSRRSLRPPQPGIRRLAILIPVHGDPIGLRQTLDTITRAVSVAEERFPHLRCSITVGIDGASDSLREVARARGCATIESTECRGKWHTLRDLLKATPNAECVALVDAGSLWEDDLLLSVLPHFRRREVVGVAPSYDNPTGGVVERVLWAFERHLKRLEDGAGGPISVHGATVFYRGRHLRRVLRRLGEGRWLNDDVVIPFQLRAAHPSFRIRYLDDVAVHDGPATVTTPGASAPDFGRRCRLVLGNVQWLRTVVSGQTPGALTVRLLALRRLTRLFWAWWLLLAGIPVLVLLGGKTGWGGIATVLILGALVAMLVRALTTAAAASLLAPLYLLAPAWAGRVRWR